MRWTLDPEAEAAVRAAERRPRPSVHLLPISEARRCYAEESVPATPVAHLNQVHDVALGGHLTGRLYRPGEGTLPVVLFFHGGGWVIGSVETHDQMCRALATESGSAVLSGD